MVMPLPAMKTESTMLLTHWEQAERKPRSGQSLCSQTPLPVALISQPTTELLHVEVEQGGDPTVRLVKKKSLELPKEETSLTVSRLSTPKSSTPPLLSVKKTPMALPIRALSLSPHSSPAKMQTPDLPLGESSRSPWKLLAVEDVRIASFMDISLQKMTPERSPAMESREG